MKHEKRNMDRLRAEMATLALADPSNLAAPVVRAEQATVASFSTDTPTFDLKNPGLTRAQLEDRRWKVSAPVAQTTFMQLGLPLQGRAAKRIYAWPLILKLEGVSEQLAHRASHRAYPHLFEDLIDVKSASLLLGMSQPHLRKLVEAGQLFGCDIIRLGARGMYRFRPAQVEDAARHRIQARLVGGASRCAQ